MADAAAQSGNELIQKGKANTCAFFMKRILPRKDVHKAVVLSAADDLLALSDQEYDYV